MESEEDLTKMTVRLPTEMKEELLREAEADGRSLSSFVRKIFTVFLEG